MVVIDADAVRYKRSAVRTQLKNLRLSVYYRERDVGIEV
jgi:hypothetical protein